jgi:hypothetical protein
VIAVTSRICRDTGKPIRFIIYITTFIYGLYNIVIGAGSIEPELVMDQTVFASVAVATFVGIVQFVATLLAFGLEVNQEKHHGLVKLCLLTIGLSYIYESFLIASASGLDEAFFNWLAFLALGVITGSTYLSYDEDVGHKEAIEKFISEI